MKRLHTSLLLLAGFALFAAASRPGSYKVGDTVTDFRLKNTDGNMVSLADYKNAKGAIVIFDCNTCPYSKAYNERIAALNKKYASQGFPVIAINANDPQISPGDSYEEMVAQARRKGYDFPYLVDESQGVAKAFGAANTPHTFVLKKANDKYTVAYIGAIDNNTRDASAATKKYVEDAVDALLANKPVPTEKTKAIGCSIKFRPG